MALSSNVCYVLQTFDLSCICPECVRYSSVLDLADVELSSDFRKVRK